MKTNSTTFIRLLILTLALCILTGNSANANQPEPLKPIQSAFNPKTATWDISWPGRVSQYDLVYLSPPVAQNRSASAARIQVVHSCLHQDASLNGKFQQVQVFV